MKKYLILFLLVSLIISAKISLAESTPTTASQDEGWSIGETVESPANCFDYYHFQSVQVSVEPNRLQPKSPYLAGEKVVFSGEIINENNYPIFDGYVFVRISRKNKNYTTEGNYIVDEFFAFKNVALRANERKKIKFNWQIPQNIQAGDYRADFFFSVGKKFNLGGLPFSNEVIIGFSEFKVLSSVENSIYFDRSKTKVNGEPYQHIGNWPIIEPTKPVKIIQPIKNTFSKEQKVEIVYDLYYWDSLDEKDRISTKKETKTIPANSSLDLIYTIPAMNESVYYLKITAKGAGQKSIVNIRIISSQERPRINYPAITKFPLKKGDKFTLFSCFHNTSDKITSGKLVVSLLDKDSKKVGEFTYNGKIGPMMMADKKEITAQKNYDYLKLIAKLYDKNNRLVDSYEAEYKCQAINNCLAKKVQKPVQKTSSKGNERVNTTLVAILLLALAVLVGYSFISKKNK